MKLKEYIEQYAVNQSALARILRVDRVTIHRICKGQRPRIDLALRIQKATRGEVTAQELLGLV